MDIADEKPLVSVLCIAYNQERYIARTLESILKQETTFAFEVIVHDDASTDSTLSIIRDFQKRYPNIIKVIAEEQNQYNKVPPGGYLEGIMRPFVRGRYIAVCEGDDYWICPNKLQKQVDYLEANQECTATCHRAVVIEGSTSEQIGYMGYGLSECDLRVEDLLDFWNIPTASLLYRSDVIGTFADDWTFDRPVGDFPRAIYLAHMGYIHYFPEVGSAYRYRTEGSYSETDQNEYIVVSRAKKWIIMDEKIDELTKYKYHRPFSIYSGRQVRKLVVREGLFNCLKVRKYREYLKELGAFTLSKMILERILYLMGFKFISTGWRQYRLARMRKNKNIQYV